MLGAETVGSSRCGEIALIDVFGYAGAIVFNFFGGSIAKHYGWPVFLAMLLSVAVMAFVSMTAFLEIDRRRASTHS